MFPFPTVVFFQGHQELSNRENKWKHQKSDVLLSVILILQNQGLELNAWLTSSLIDG